MIKKLLLKLLFPEFYEVYEYWVIRNNIEHFKARIRNQDVDLSILEEKVSNMENVLKNEVYQELKKKHGDKNV